MEVSTFEENEPLSKRKRTIQYHKVRSRLNQSRHRSNFLNKSVYSENICKQLNESKSKETLVSVRNVESFLAINRDLAKALQDLKLQLKSAEKKENEIQLQCIETRGKLNTAVSALLKCKCKREVHHHDPSSQDLLPTMHATISQCERMCREYMDSVALNKVSCVDAEVQTEVGALLDCGVQTEKVHTRSVRLQVALDSAPPASISTTSAGVKHTATQTVEGAKVPMKNKLIQCCISGSKGGVGSEVRESSVLLVEKSQANKQQPKKPSMKSQDKSVMILENPKQVKTSLNKPTSRTPLEPIDFNIIDDKRKTTKLKLKKEKNLIGQSKKKSSFQIFADEPVVKMKKINEVSNRSPPLSRSSTKHPNVEEGGRLRPRQRRPNYTEAVTQITNRTKRRRKLAKKVVVPPLESIISMVHDSLMKSFSMRL